ncbi:MAG: glycosyltransferase family 4 protein [Planctomycetota bacterium]
MPPHAKPTLLIISQVFVPDPAAVGQQIADVAQEMVRRGWQVVVYTASRGYEDPSSRYPRRQVIDGVEVRRIPLSSFGKSSIVVRLIAGAFFLTQAVVHSFFMPHLSLVLVSTSPPFAGIGGVFLSWLRRVPLVWWVMDLNPDQMVAAGRLARTSVVAWVFDWMNRLTIAHARDVITLDRFMTVRLLQKWPCKDKVQIVPPWPHDDVLSALPRKPNPFRDAHLLGGAFVVMYSGNHAIQHPLHTLLEAASRLKSTPDLLFVFVGGGAGKSQVEKRIQDGATNIVSLPFQKRNEISDSLSAADVHVVSMGDEVVGIVHPCKIYGAMAVGRPILFFGAAESHVGEIMAAHSIGCRINHGDVDGAVAAIQHFRTLSESARNILGCEAASIVRSRFSQRASVARVADILCGSKSPQPLQQLP